MDEIIIEFLTESQEGLDQLDNKFVMLEQNPEDRDTLASIFRTVHTIKGTCGFLGFTHLEKLTHAGENLLSLLRDGKLSFTQDMASALLNMLDAVRIMLTAIEQTEADGDQDYLELIETLSRLKEGGPAPPAAAPVPPPPPPEPVVVEEPPAPEEPSSLEPDEPAAKVENLLPPGSVFLLQPPPAKE
ncbi:MAG TPA: hybrid sensor histidine kinase/response regulator, partial [Gammaproteobacteria bacterium]|nr:hybrid sensor histidine kinase/response regulator [Gammaproteobacteria bacterium]